MCEEKDGKATANVHTEEEGHSEVCTAGGQAVVLTEVSVQFFFLIMLLSSKDVFN